ncbi:ribonuclease-like 3 [Dicentrarchus labrax]|uniref:ribonuclease-like 3 n=1 Tax=Dicentrarchus labrax TaxID=13489 RepID=UPI0021F5FF0C|nr:ribonuclease-like 3 [Dicentrarchus labrax]
MKIQLVCLLLVLLTATVLTQDTKINKRYKKFINQHIIKTMSARSCYKEMQERKINIKKSMCKKINTFILASAEDVRSVCVDKGVPYHKMTKSIEDFDIVVCNRTNKQGKRAKCQYHGDKLKNKKILIKCEKGFPVHYDGDIGYCDN